jgi:[ribosomal protein S5]-alanine N-acetyltransferase
MTVIARLETARFILRPVAALDEAAVVAALNVIDVSGWLASVPYPYAASDFQYFLSEIAVPGWEFAIEDAGGFAGIMGLDEDRVFGYWLCPHAQGKGYATEAAKAVLQMHFEHDPSAIVSGYFEGNVRSANVLAKLGFIETGRGPRHCRALGQERAHVDLTLSKPAFEARNRVT